MTKIVDTGISITSLTATQVKLLLGVDTRFTGSDLTQGQSGAAKFEMTCTIWDEDTFNDDQITSRTQLMPPASIHAVTGIDMPFEFPLSELRSREAPFETTIELYGEFTLRRNGTKVGPSAKSHIVKVRLNGPPPPPPTRHIEVSTEGSGLSTIVVTKGSKFTPGSVVVVRFTDPRLAQLQAIVTTGADGTFTSRRQVPCAPGITFTVTAFEDTNPSGTIANAVVTTCP